MFLKKMSGQGLLPPSKRQGGRSSVQYVSLDFVKKRDYLDPSGLIVHSRCTFNIPVKEVFLYDKRLATSILSKPKHTFVIKFFEVIVSVKIIGFCFA